MRNITFEDAAGGRTVRLAGEAGIEHAADLKSALLDALGSGSPARVDLTAVESIDMPVFQLLISARRGFAARALAFDVTDSPDRVLSRFSRTAGVVELEEMDHEQNRSHRG